MYYGMPTYCFSNYPVANVDLAQQKSNYQANKPTGTSAGKVAAGATVGALMLYSTVRLLNNKAVRKSVGDFCKKIFKFVKI